MKGPNAGSFIVSAFKAPAGVDFVRRAEVVIDLDVDLLPDIGGADTEAVVGTMKCPHPSVPACVQPIADFPIVHRRHNTEQLCDVARSIDLSPIRIPRRALDDCVGTIRLCGSVLEAAEHAGITQN